MRAKPQRGTSDNPAVFNAKNNVTTRSQKDQQIRCPFVPW